MSALSQFFPQLITSSGKKLKLPLLTFSSYNSIFKCSVPFPKESSKGSIKSPAYSLSCSGELVGEGPGTELGFCPEISFAHV